MTSLPRRVTSGAAVILIAALSLFAFTARVIAHKTVVSPFTYYGDVKPIVDRRCAQCHAGSPNLRALTFDAAAAWPYQFQRSLLTHPAGIDDLSVGEFDTLMTWSVGGAPEGVRPEHAPVSQLPRRHAAHAGEHGGVVLALFDDSLHVEAVWREQRRFRLYFSNVEGRLFGPGALREWHVGVSGPSKKPAPAAPAPDGESFEARIESTPLPGTFQVVVRRADDSEDSAGITFTSHSMPPTEFSLAPTVIPPTPPGIVSSIQEQASIAQRMLSGSQFGTLFQPMTRVRDLVLALKPGGTAQTAATQLLIRATWSLHIAGDEATPFETKQAGVRFDAAMAEFIAVFVP